MSILRSLKDKHGEPDKMEIEKEELFDRALKLYEAEEYRKAADSLNELLNIDSNYEIETGGLYFRLANCHYFLGEIPKSIEYMKQLVSKSPCESSFQYLWYFENLAPMKSFNQMNGEEIDKCFSWAEKQMEKVGV